MSDCILVITKFDVIGYAACDYPPYEVKFFSMDDEDGAVAYYHQQVSYIQSNDDCGRESNVTMFNATQRRQSGKKGQGGVY